MKRLVTTFLLASSVSLGAQALPRQSGEVSLANVGASR